MKKYALLGALCVLAVHSFALAQESAKFDDPAWPALLLCGDREIVGSTFGRVDWEREFEEDLKDVQPQYLHDHYLVSGGSRQVALLRRVADGFQEDWSWRGLSGVSVVSAVTADWDPKDRPSLILAADAANQRIFLGEAKDRPKIRWEYKLPAKPLAVKVCPDTGNFLVTMEGSLIQEIFFQEDKVAWAVGPENGLKDAQDAIRGPWAKTYVADAATGTVYAFNPRKDLFWKAKLPFIPSLPVEHMGLTLYKKNGKRMILVSARFAKSRGAKSVVYLLSADTGNVLSWRDRMEKGEYPDFFKVIPDMAVYQKKQ